MGWRRSARAAAEVLVWGGNGLLVVEIGVVEGGRRGWGVGGEEVGRGGGEGAPFCGCGRNAGLLFWAAVVMNVEGGMEEKTV